MHPILLSYPVFSITGFNDPVSSLSHLIASLAFVIMAILLIRRGRGNKARVIFLSIFSFSCFFLLSMSGIYHLLDPGPDRDILQRLDHAAIFILIAGSFTSIHGILFKGIMRWGILLLVWSIAITGTTLKSIYFSEIPEWLSYSVYLGLGWVGLGTAIALYKYYGLSYVKPLVYSGLAYTIGAMIEFLRLPMLITGVVGSHELFHIAVIIGVTLHWRFTWSFANGSATKKAAL